MFCSNCGTQLPDGTKFCNNCGAQQTVANPAPAQPVEPAPAAQPVYQQTVEPVTAPEAPVEKVKKKKSGMKIAGIVLLVLQVVALLSQSGTEDFAEWFTTGIPGICKFIGFCSFGVIGVVLLVLDKKKNG